jgi:DNA-binding response OmpR family regulator
MAFEVGGADYITKPFSPNDMLKRVKQVLENQETPTNSN